MSAIFGIIDLEGRTIEDAWVESMQANLGHRGPDGKTLYTRPSLVLGHMLLQVTPESVYNKGVYEEGDLVITANARLDERQHLMERLHIDPAEFSRVTDTILLLRAYKKWGKDFVKDMYGDFSFAIWDKKTRQLFCARDQVGVKPLFYYIKDGRFVFSTELRSIVRLPFVDTKMDQEYFRDRAVAICDQPCNSGWSNIMRLQPATTLSLNDAALQTKQYWKPVYKRNKAFKTEEDSAGAVRQLLEKIIADHTRTTGNVGATLSGGLDSGTITCLAAKKLLTEDKQLISASSIYTPGYSNPESPDEMEYINAVLEQEKNIIPTFVHHTDHSFIKTLAEKFRRNYAPVNAFYYVDEALYNRFQAKSVRRVLSGYLGDLTVTNSSINPFTILMGSGRVRALRQLSARYNIQDKQPLFAFLKYSIFKEFTPKWFQVAWNRYKKREAVSRDVGWLPLRLSKEQQKILQQKVDNTFRFPNRGAHDMVNQVWPKDVYLFDEEEDCAASHHQLEVTYPLCDRRLIELLMQIPVEHYYAGGIKRGLIRKAMAGILPEKIRIRKTKGSYSPGYTKLIQKEIDQIVEIFNTGWNEAEVSDMIDIQKLKMDFKNLSESEIEDSFTYCNWTLIEIFIWLYCSKTLENKKINKHE
jgi:asparagine synthase (glutamine-hydrolysing)